MQFNSVNFIFYFLPAFLAVYHLAPGRARWGLLAAGSFIFYGFATGWSVIALAALALCLAWTIGAGLILEKKKSPWLLVLAVAVPAGALVFFKLYRGGELLPAGMSFYVFGVIAALVEVKKGRLAVRGYVRGLTTEVAMFPKLMSGPIADPVELRRQTERPHRTLYTFHLGLQQFIIGLGLKTLLADRLGGVWSRANIVGLDSISTPFAWLALISFSMRLYFDFYGYSMMAVGLGHMLGYHLPMNFLEPYSSKSVSEFYRRWHATLGRWFREYIYIPMGGNRKGRLRTALNLFAVWLLTGLWHGVGGGYLIWAGALFLLILNERLWLKKYLERTRVLPHVYTVVVILLTWAAFAAGTGERAIMFYGRLFGVGGILDDADFVTWGRQYWAILLAGAVFASPLPKLVWEKIERRWYADVLLFAVFWAAVYFIATAGQDPFMYFNF